MKYIKKSESKLMRLLSWVLKPIAPTFMDRFWTTLGNRIYVPSLYDFEPDWGTVDWEIRHGDIVKHEQVHVEQFKRVGFPIMALAYVGPAPFLLPLVWIHWSVALAAGLLAPLTFGLAYGRWRIERTAYLENIKAGAPIDWVVETLWKNYGWCWPRSWMRRWFSSQL